MDTVQIFPWGVQVPLLEALARTFRLFLQELWNWNPVVNVFITIPVLLTHTAGLYLVTSSRRSFLSPCQPASLSFHHHTPLPEQGHGSPCLATAGLYSFTALQVLPLTNIKGKRLYLSFFKIRLLTFFYKEWRQTGISGWRFSSSSEINPTIPDPFLVETEG